MRFSTAVLALLPAAGALAAEIKVTVGDSNKLAFDPPSVTAAVGDTIKFQFKSKNHTVTQSTFDNPCVFKADGVDSGFKATPPESTDFATWTFEVKATDPLWFFCAQTAPANHCTNGMVFAVNAATSGDKTFDAYKAKAMNNAGSGNAPAGGNSTGTAASGSATGSASASGSAASGSASATGASGSSSASGAAATGSSSTGASASPAGGSNTESAAASQNTGAGNGASTMSGNSIAMLSVASLVLALTL